MFKLNKKLEINRNILKCIYIRHSPSKIKRLSTAKSQIHIKNSTEDSVISLLNSYLDLKFDVLHAACNDTFADYNYIRLFNFGPTAIFSTYKITTSSGKRLEDISGAPIVFLMYELITGARDTDEFSFGFDRDRERRQRELTKNKTQKSIIHLRFMLNDKFGFSESHEKRTFGLGYKLTLTRNTDNASNND